MSDLDDLLTLVMGMRHDLAEVKHKQNNQVKVGVVAERDHEKGVRLRIGGTDEEPVLSGWLQPSGISGVTRYLPREKETMAILSPNGDTRLATVIPLDHTDEKPNPAADKDETVFHKLNGMKISEKDGVRTVEVGDTKIVEKDGSVTTTVGETILSVLKNEIKDESKKITSTAQTAKYTAQKTTFQSVLFRTTGKTFLGM